MPSSGDYGSGYGGSTSGAGSGTGSDSGSSGDGGYQWDSSSSFTPRAATNEWDKKGTKRGTSDGKYSASKKSK